MSEKRRLQLSLDPDVLDGWNEQAAREGVSVSQWVTIRANRPDCPLSLDYRMDKLIEVLELMSIGLGYPKAE